MSGHVTFRREPDVLVVQDRTLIIAYDHVQVPVLIQVSKGGGTSPVRVDESKGVASRLLDERRIHRGPNIFVKEERKCAGGSFVFGYRSLVVSVKIVNHFVSDDDV